MGMCFWHVYIFLHQTTRSIVTSCGWITLYQLHSPHPAPLKPSYTYMTCRLAEQVAGAISCIPEIDLLKVPALLIDMDSLIQSPNMLHVGCFIDCFLGQGYCKQKTSRP